LSPVGRADAECTHNRRPAGVTRSFQVPENSIEPGSLVRRLFANLSDNVGTGNLFSENNGRSASGDELEEHGPEMALIVFSFALPGA